MPGGENVMGRFIKKPPVPVTPSVDISPLVGVLAIPPV
jgi:hypothetical protein